MGHQGPPDCQDSLELLVGRGSEDSAVEMELEDVKVQKERKAVKGPQGLQETPGLFPSKERKETQDPQESTGFLDHEEIKVHKELLVIPGTLASPEPPGSKVYQDPEDRTAYQGLLDYLGAQEHKASLAFQERQEIKVTKDV